MSKSVSTALLELKTADREDDEVSIEPFTHMQERRRAAKMMAIADFMESKSGVKLPTIGAKINSFGREPGKISLTPS